MPAPISEPDPAAPKLVCLGNLTLDDIVQPDGTERPGCVGGDAIYGVLAARLFEPRAEMVAPVGRDLPPAVRTLIASAGLSQMGLPRRDCPTLRNRIVYRTPDRRLVSLLSDQANFERLSPRGEDVPESFWDAGGIMILAMTLDAQRDLVQNCRTRSRAIVALDPQEEYIAGNEAAIAGLIAQLDLFMPSRDEARQLLGHGDPRRAARQFAALGPRIVVIKLGADGCLVHDAGCGQDLLVPAYPGVPVDTTGAGDAFCSAFLTSLVDAPADLRAAAIRGVVAASFAVSSYGVDALFAATPADARDRVARMTMAMPPMS